MAKLEALLTRSTNARNELATIPKLIERYKQAVLAAAFRGDLTADWRDKNSNGDASTFLKEHDITIFDNYEQEIPFGWHWVKAGDLCNVKSGLALGKKRKLDEKLLELPYLRVANVQRGWLDLSEVKTVLVTQREADALRLLSGDILMNEGGDRDKLGRGWIWDGQIENCLHQNHVFRLRLKAKAIPPKYISYYANNFGQNYFMDQGKQTTNLASISMTKLSGFPIPVAPTQ